MSNVLREGGGIRKLDDWLDLEEGEGMQGKALEMVTSLDKEDVKIEGVKMLL